MTRHDAGNFATSRSTNSRLQGSLRARAEVPPNEVDRLHELFARHYRHVDRETFDRDWEEKDQAILLRDGTGELQGFTTLKLHEIELGGKRLRAVFSGNTIIEPAFWGDLELVRVWCAAMARFKACDPSIPLYWYLISSGFRTYLYLPLFFREFFPRFDAPTPPFAERLIDLLGRLRYPTEYSGGVIHVTSPRECLRPDLAVPGDARIRNPHVRFFLERNPGFLKGDELVCIAEYSPENTRRSAREALLHQGIAPCSGSQGPVRGCARPEDSARFSPGTCEEALAG